MIFSGALDSIHKNRKEMYNNIDKLLSYNALVAKEQSSYQINLFDNQNDKYEIKFYEQNSADTNSPWKNENGKKNGIKMERKCKKNSKDHVKHVKKMERRRYKK